MALSELRCKTAKPKEKAYKISDSGGLFLLIKPNGSKYFRQKYYFQGKEKMLAHGVYPDVPLKYARELRDDARRLLAQGINPSEARKAEKVSQSGLGSFETIAREWHSQRLHTWTEKHGKQILRRLELNIFPWLGKKAINLITPPELLAVLRRMQSRGAVETAHRVHACCGQIIRYAIATGRAERDISQDIKGAIPPTKTKHLASITDPVEIGGLLRAIEGYKGSLIVRYALKMAPLVFVRPSELRQAEWSEFNLEKREWRIPPEKMKARGLHIVPLSQQVIDILEELRPLTGQGDMAKYLFHNPRTITRPLSNNGVLSAIRRMGYTKDEMTGHGFRSMASTLLNERGYKGDAIERQLAHSEGNGARAAYNYAEYMPERIMMMQEWADYLDQLKAGSEVVQLKAGNM